MAPTFRNAYAGGYSDEIRKRLQHVPIPEKIKCGNCHKVRSMVNYSNRQLESLRHAILAQGQRIALAKTSTKCRTCTGNQTVELKCCVCDIVKGLDDFAKAQRQDRDAARCMNCVQSHAEAVPLLDEHKLLTEIEPSTAYDTRTSNPFDENSLIASTRRLTVKNILPIAYRDQGQLEKDEGNEDNVSVAGQVLIKPEQNHDKNFKDQGSVLSAHGTQGIAYRHATSPLGAPKSVHSGWASWGVRTDVTSPAADPDRLATKQKPSNFAKVPGKRFERHEAPTMRVPEPNGQYMVSDDENEGDDSVEDYL